MKLLALACLLLIVNCIHSLRILAVLPFPSKSHFAIGHSIVKSLVEAGHEATVLTPYKLKEPIRNYNVVDIKEILQILERPDFNPFLIHKMPSILTIPLLHSMGSDVTNLVMNHPEVQKIMASNEKYDICFLEVFHANALSGIFDHVNCTYIPYTSAAVTQWSDIMTSNESPTSYVPMGLLPYSEKMNFGQRFLNTFYAHLENLSYYLFHLPTQRKLYNKYFPNAKKSYDEMIKSPTMMFLGNHFSVSSARPSMPNMINIGGIHVEEAKPLPADIQQFLDSADNGVILFSMGSIVQANQFPVAQREAFVKVFSQLKVKVLWKYENETLPNKPENVKISSWLPQRDILAHKNVKLFITHGGFLGFCETTAEGVPILGLPMFGDQPMNVENAVYNNRGLALEFEDITEELLMKTIKDLLENQKYAENAKVAAQKYKDRLVQPKQAVVYWTEYVARHNNAKHLRAAANDLNFLQYHLIDVYALMFALILIVIYLKYKLLTVCVRKVFKSQKPKEKTK